MTNQIVKMILVEPHSGKQTGDKIEVDEVKAETLKELGIATNPDEYVSPETPKTKPKALKSKKV